jgi:hypothetical protein
LVQELFCLTFEFLEHHAVAILGMTGYDKALYDNGVVVEPDESAPVEGCLQDPWSDHRRLGE